ncbi:uncharacterized protein LOC115376608 [Myripristis murdjan]|uniref:uncharacterized protein LOC115376608 n=1 Tax=Myripristis murdjan TaxID=586833 RepID=UPI001175F091|nr:uncharacterized protein LOC115376608 [Myripristis murdjan]
MEAVNRDQMVPEPSPENVPGVPTAIETFGHPNAEALHNFALNMANNIICSFTSQLPSPEPEADCRTSSYNHDQEMLAEELSSAVMEAALREACRGQTVNLRGNFQRSSYPPSSQHVQGEAGVKTERGQAGKPSSLNASTREKARGTSLDMDIDSDGTRETSFSRLSSINAASSSSAFQTSRCTQPCHPPLSQSGLPIMGSLDYPDAPPTTPLLPELIRSRDSFARKLKGGLAKEFLPSPPPPTPQDKENETKVAGGHHTAAAVDPRVELMEHLMRSLSTEYSEEEEEVWREELARVVDSYGGGNDELEPPDMAKMAAYADALSGDIIGWVITHYPLMLRARNTELIEDDDDDDDDDDDIHLLAHRLAQTILTCSLSEIQTAV